MQRHEPNTKSTQGELHPAQTNAKRNAAYQDHWATKHERHGSKDNAEQKAAWHEELMLTSMAFLAGYSMISCNDGKALGPDIGIGTEEIFHCRAACFNTGTLVRLPAGQNWAWLGSMVCCELFVIDSFGIPGFLCPLSLALSLSLWKKGQAVYNDSLPSEVRV